MTTMTLRAAAVAASLLLAGFSANAAYIKLSDANGLARLLAGNNGDSPNYSLNGVNYVAGGNAFVDTGNVANTSPLSLWTTGVTAYTDHAVLFVFGGLVIAQLDHDYLGGGVQKLTYTNYAAQGLIVTAPGASTATQELRTMSLTGNGQNYQGFGDFNAHQANTAFYNDGILVSAASVAALNSVSAPASLALAGLALALMGFTTRRRA